MFSITNLASILLVFICIILLGFMYSVLISNWCWLKLFISYCCKKYMDLSTPSHQAKKNNNNNINNHTILKIAKTKERLTVKLTKQAKDHYFSLHQLFNALQYTCDSRVKDYFLGHLFFLAATNYYEEEEFENKITKNTILVHLSTLSLIFFFLSFFLQPNWRRTKRIKTFTLTNIQTYKQIPHSTHTHIYPPTHIHIRTRTHSPYGRYIKNTKDYRRCEIEQCRGSQN